MRTNFNKEDKMTELLSELTAEIVSAYVSHNAISADKLPELIVSVYAALGKTPVQDVESGKAELTPAVSIKKSITPEHIICLEDGKKFKSLKRHLSARYNLTPDEYRARWNLPGDYPMVAPAYAATRSNLAKNMGLGRK